ncbi:MAG TPA: hypothetical protein VIH58_04890 [Chthoniobacterales bacterium]|jgi:hypothetical protein
MPDDPLSPESVSVMAAVQELADKIAAINPNLVVQITCGPRKKAAGVSGNVDLAQKADLQEDIRINWTDGNHFTNTFSKTGDGFANVSYLQ